MAWEKVGKNLEAVGNKDGKEGKIRRSGNRMIHRERSTILLVTQNAP